jgi:hypothetical protein
LELGLDATHAQADFKAEMTKLDYVYERFD